MAEVFFEEPGFVRGVGGALAVGRALGNVAGLSMESLLRI